MTPTILLAQLVTEATEPPQELVSVVVTAIVSASVFAALITGFIQYMVNRRNSRITERKNSVEAESDLVSRYKEAAAEERAQKESAVQTIHNLLQMADDQVASLKSTVKMLNDLIATLNKAANAQQEIIDQLINERDRSQAALKRALSQIQEQKADLARHQQEILKLTFPDAELAEIRKQLEAEVEGI